jgi:hypothetical protein
MRETSASFPSQSWLRAWLTHHPAPPLMWLVATSRPTTSCSSSDMLLNVKALDMGPFRRSHQHGPPLLGRVQGRPCSPTSSLVCSPPTPCLHRPPLRFPLLAAYLVAGAYAVPHEADDTCARKRVVRRRRVTDSPHSRNVFEERRGPPRLRGRPLPYVPWSNTPPDTILSLPRSHAGDGGCLRVIQDPRHPGSRGFGAAFPWPARSPAYASPTPFLQPSQGWLPAGRAHPWPGGFRTRWMTNNISWRTCVLQSQLTHMAWSHCTSYP